MPGAFAHTAATAPIITLLLPGTPPQGPRALKEGSSASPSPPPVVRTHGALEWGWQCARCTAARGGGWGWGVRAGGCLPYCRVDLRYLHPPAPSLPRPGTRSGGSGLVWSHSHASLRAGAEGGCTLRTSARGGGGGQGRGRGGHAGVIPSTAARDGSRTSDSSSETIHCRPYPPPAVLTQRGPEVTGVHRRRMQRPPHGPLLPPQR